MNYIDAHIHLQDVPEPDRAGLLDSAKAQGFQHMFCNGINPQDWSVVAKIAQENPDFVVPFFGVHPWHADKVSVDWEDRLRGFLTSVKSGVGEIGLDRTQNAGDFDAQKNVFGCQLKIAGELNRPFIVHAVRCWGILIDLLNAANIKVPFLIHCFMGPVEIAEKLIRLGAYLSISLKLLSDKNQNHIQEVFCDLPLDRVLFETDYPYVPKSVELMIYARYIPALYEKAASIKKVSVLELQKQVFKNGAIFKNAVIDR